MIMSLPDEDGDQDWKAVATSLAGMEDRLSRTVHTKLLQEAARINGGHSPSDDKITALFVRRNSRTSQNKQWLRPHPYQGPQPKPATSSEKCRYPLCGKLGHWEKDCYLRKRHEEEARVRESGSSELGEGSNGSGLANVAVQGQKSVVRKFHL